MADKIKSHQDAQKERFKTGLSRWFINHGFQEGLPGEDITINGQTDFVNQVGEVVSTLFGGLTPKFSGGASAEKATALLLPLMELSDSSALKVELNVQIFLVIYADQLEYTQLQQRLEQIAILCRPLAKLGIRRFGFQSMGTQVFPMMVYFDRRRFNQVVPKLTEEGIKIDFLHWRGMFLGQHVTMETAFIDIQSKEVKWAQGGSILSKTRAPVEKIYKSIGKEARMFTTKDLRTFLD